ncbi:RNA polymerase sigma factor [Nonomuraea typhae]|uniref:RNA polymerase sigma factor n=1 Tax=Nonomuraea typhae TaxID=2603600 RepID=UPI0012FAF376|nr:sigma-70 family RNA polymerase sigma factor [Nonomuraea typhae]
MTAPAIEDLLREQAPQVLGALVRRYGHFDLAEDAVQEALIAAAAQWPQTGPPDNPRAWLITVAARRLTDLLRSEQARRRREDDTAALALPGAWLSPAADRPPPDGDDTLILLFLCCHPALAPNLQVALTLRSVGGLTTREIARAFFVPEPAMSRRITRAKQRIKDSGLPFRLPCEAERGERGKAVLHVLYLIFTEGYASTTGPDLVRGELTTEAIRLARIAHRLLPGDAEAAGLLALMLLTDARRPARRAPDGSLVPLAEQDRSLWRRDHIAEGAGLITRTLPKGPAGPYQLQAAIAALHDEAPSAAQTDWPQIAALYEVLIRVSGNPMAVLNHAVALAMVHGPQAGLRRLADAEAALSGHHRVHAVRAHLLEMSGDREGARAEYERAAARTASLQEQRYLYGRAARQ